jgi:hypothetical protein
MTGDTVFVLQALMTPDTARTTTSRFMSIIPALGIQVACSLLIRCRSYRFTGARNP